MSFQLEKILIEEALIFFCGEIETIKYALISCRRALMLEGRSSDNFEIIKKIIKL